VIRPEPWKQVLEAEASGCYRRLLAPSIGGPAAVNLRDQCVPPAAFTGTSAANLDGAEKAFVFGRHCLISARG
jgi:hypothetical protein